MKLLRAWIFPYRSRRVVLINLHAVFLMRPLVFISLFKKEDLLSLTCTLRNFEMPKYLGSTSFAHSLGSSFTIFQTSFAIITTLKLQRFHNERPSFPLGLQSLFQLTGIQSLCQLIGINPLFCPSLILH